METPVRSLPTVEKWRREIESALAVSRAGDLAAALDAGRHAHALVVKILDVHPCIGKVAGRRLLTDEGIDHGVTVGLLPHEKLVVVGGRCRCSRA